MLKRLGMLAAGLIFFFTPAHAATTTSIVITIAPCTVNVEPPAGCVRGSTAVPGQEVQLTAHVVYTGTTAPTGSLCLLENGASTWCNLTPVTNESWTTSRIPTGVVSISATYGGDSNYSPSTSTAVNITVGTAVGPPPPPPPPPPTGPVVTFSGTTPAGAAVSTALSSASPINVSVTLANGFTVSGTVAAAPTIKSISPASGPAGTGITITGTGFVAPATAFLTCPSGSSTTFPLSSVVVVNATTITATTGTGPGNAGSTPVSTSCDVTVTVP